MLHSWLLQEEKHPPTLLSRSSSPAGMAGQAALGAVALFLLSSTLTNVSSHLVGHRTRNVNNGLFEIDKGVKPLNAPMVCEQSFIYTCCLLFLCALFNKITTIRMLSHIFKVAGYINKLLMLTVFQAICVIACTMSILSRLSWLELS